MRKFADTLAEQGHSVRWVFVSWTKRWAVYDDSILRTAGWKGERVVAHGMFGTLMRTLSGLRVRAHRRTAQTARPLAGSRLFRAHSRAFEEIRSRTLRQPADLIIGGTEGGMAPARAAALASGTPYALDLEDLYGETRVGDARWADDLARAVEDVVIPDAVFCTVPSNATAKAYQERFPRDFAVVHNTFPLPSRTPDFAQRVVDPLRLCWFGQTVGDDRGLEDVVAAIRMSGAPVQLRVMGTPVAGYRDLLSNQAATALHLDLSWSAPVPPDCVLDWCRGSDIGLSTEGTHPRNRNVCLTNKALTYPLAGLALLCTQTAGQRELAPQFGAGARYYRPGDVATLTKVLRSWHDDRTDLLRARRASWAAAQARWHWGHVQERGHVAALVAEALSSARS